MDRQKWDAPKSFGIMKDIAIVFSTSTAYLSQALAMYEQLKNLRVQDLAWVVPLEKLDNYSYQCLKTRFGKQVTDVLSLPENIKVSGNKPFLPKMLPKHKHYILIDTDLIILRKNFFNHFITQVNPRVTLIAETFTCSEFLKKTPWQKVYFDYFPEILNKPYLQTGTIGIPHSIYSEIFDFLVRLITKIKVTIGDLQAWNYIACQYPQLFKLIAPQHCLVLRPDGSGFSSTFHLPDITREQKKLKYKGYLIDAIHYTSSKGNIVTIKEYQDLIYFA